ncbi:MAG: HEPN domain-containing protein [Planctomycetota bacterium]
MPKKQLDLQPYKAKHSCLTASSHVYDYALSTCQSVLDRFDADTAARGVGKPNTSEQDLLRSAIVFAASGLDSCLKYAIRDSLEELIQVDDHCKAKFEEFVDRRLKNAVEGSSSARRDIARTLVQPDPRPYWIESMIRSLVGDSLQSVDELVKLLNTLGLSTTLKQVKDRSARLKNVFHARNQIIHELDVDFTKQQKRRRSRKRPEAIEAAVDLLSVARKSLEEIDLKLES